MIAIKPPVLVPPIKSKYSHGRGVSSASVWRSIVSMISRRIRRDESPRTPPPSKVSARGARGSDIVKERFRQGRWSEVKREAGGGAAGKGVPLLCVRIKV